MKENKKKWGGKREGAGRKVIFEGERIPIRLNLVKHALELLSKESEETGISRSDLVNKFILNHFKRIKHAKIAKTKTFD